MIIYVDDILLTGCSERMDKVIESLKKEFNAKDMGDVTNYLGIEVKRSSETLQLTQTKLINKILEEFKMTDCNGTSTPMETTLQITEGEPIIQVPYRKLIGSLMYIATTTRPDIMFCVSYLSRFLDKPTDKIWKAGKRILRYLQETKNLSIIYKKTTENEKIEAYSDADWAQSKIDRRSVSGSIIFYGGNPVSWFSKKQHCVALSTAEAEYIAAASTAQDIVNLRGVINEFSVNSDCILYIDNKSTILMSKTYENSKRMKHIDIRHHFLKDLICNGDVVMNHVCSSNNIADILTKPLCKEKFTRFRTAMSIS